MLYDGGHPPDRVDTYTIDQVRAFSQAIDRARRRRETALAIIVRAANLYEADDFTAFLKD